ncbi:MAG TPA: TIR domain-containing protein [Acidimicrobiia bacterium]
MSAVFLSYRREDAEASTGRLRDRLIDSFGESAVFLDVDDIKTGENFRVVISGEITECDAVCVVIGRRWATVERDGHRRLFFQDDPVRREIVGALEAEVPIIPVLVDGAALPAGGELPEAIRPLLDQDAIELRADSYDDDVDALIEAIAVKLPVSSLSFASATAAWHRLSRPRQIVSGILGILGAVMLIVGIWDRFGPEPRPIVRMTGDVNVAVAEFASQLNNGNQVVTEESSGLAHSVYRLIAAELGADSRFDYQVLDPSITGTLRGRSVSERVDEASRLAEETRADVIVFATITESDSRVSAAPEFFITDRNLVDRAEELVGRYELGPPVQQAGSLTANPVVRQQVRTELLRRMTNLVGMIIGLSHFGVHQYPDAMEAFLEVEEGQPLGTDEGADILHLFLGNTAGRMNDLERAEEEFRTSLGINNDSSRAKIGLAETTFQQARDRCDGPGLDVAGVEESVGLYEEARTAADRPVHADIDAKVDLGLGRALLCLSEAGVRPAYDEAISHFDRVVRTHEDGELRSSELAAEAWSGKGLALIGAADSDAELRSAVAAFDEAIALGDLPDRRSVWYGFQGFAHCLLNERASAVQSYERAISLSSSQEVVTEYEEASSRAADGPGNGC